MDIANGRINIFSLLGHLLPKYTCPSPSLSQGCLTPTITNVSQKNHEGVFLLSVNLILSDLILLYWESYISEPIYMHMFVPYVCFNPRIKIHCKKFIKVCLSVIIPLIIISKSNISFSNSRNTIKMGWRERVSHVKHPEKDNYQGPGKSLSSNEK